MKSEYWSHEVNVETLLAFNNRRLEEIIKLLIEIRDSQRRNDKYEI